ncbi:MAG: DUF4080 domain-containing protein [Burkholderiaceae bacterium]|nr:DUF4080 domain-containing protein [Burkholderiaceae bacterium]
MPELLLCTLNARHAHASLGLRCLRANLGGLRARSHIVEFVIGARTEDMAEKLLAQEPRVIGFGVYIWNVEQTTRLVELLRRIAPDVKIVLGGPEVSHETAEQPICVLADHIVTGSAELAFARLAGQLLDGPRPLMKIVPGDAPDLASLVLPYDEYSDRDLRERHLYIEASRGCPFKCEFCLSALDKTAWPFELTRVLQALATLHARGARHFRFVDRTFNLKAATGAAILEFFLARIEAEPDDPVFAHFELVPDHLPDALRALIVRFPPGCLQFEIGIQTWNPQVQALISRRQDNAKAAENLRWLLRETHAHLHVDLIAGLPGEDEASFGAGFDRLAAIGPHEIQLGILKRLRGAPIARHTMPHDLRFNPAPPYNVLSTRFLSFAQMQRLTRFARYWDLIANSGRFPRSLVLLLGEHPFARFMTFSDWLYARTDATHRVAAERLYELVHEWLTHGVTGESGAGEGTAGSAAPAQRAIVDQAIRADYEASGARGRPAFLSHGLSGAIRAAAAPGSPARGPAIERQTRHLQGHPRPALP